jgi:hypothetical protein
MRHEDDGRIIYMERESNSSIKALLIGALIGAGLALLYAPQSGEETRRGLKRRLRKVRALAEEKVDELGERLSGRGRVAPPPGFHEEGFEAMGETDDDLEAEMEPTSGRGGAREELERRLEQARARRRGVPAEEPRS